MGHLQLFLLLVLCPCWAENYTLRVQDEQGSSTLHVNAGTPIVAAQSFGTLWFPLQMHVLGNVNNGIVICKSHRFLIHWVLGSVILRSQTSADINDLSVTDVVYTSHDGGGNWHWHTNSSVQKRSCYNTKPNEMLCLPYVAYPMVPPGLANSQCLAELDMFCNDPLTWADGSISLSRIHTPGDFYYFPSNFF